MTDRLHDLAESAGLALRWRDVHGQWHEVGPDTLRTVLGALGLPASSDAEIDDSLASLKSAARLPPMLTADTGGWLAVPDGAYHLVLEDGREQSGMVQDGRIRVPDAPGYHRLHVAGQDVVLAAAPPRGWTVADAAPGGRLWALAVQLYALRRSGDAGIGDFGGLAAFVGAAATQGAAAVAISPVHAQFSATPDRFSPYSPSSRTLLNVLHAKVDITSPEAAALEARPLIDWPAASRLRLAHLDGLVRRRAGNDALGRNSRRFRKAAGLALEGHARFEALHSAFHVGRGRPVALAQLGQVVWRTRPARPSRALCA